MDAEVRELWETSRVISLGSGVVARVILWQYQSPRGSTVRASGFESAGAKGEWKGRDVSLLCARLRVVRLGRAQRFVGRDSI